MSGRFKRSISIILIYGKREEKLDNLFISCHSLERNLVAEEVSSRRGIGKLRSILGKISALYRDKFFSFKQYFSKDNKLFHILILFHGRS